MGQYPEVPGAQGVATSVEAAKAITSIAGELCRMSYRVIAGSTGLTADEVAAMVGESVLSIRPRVAELNRLGSIVDSGRRRKNVSGRSAAVWVIAPQTGGNANV